MAEAPFVTRAQAALAAASARDSAAFDLQPSGVMRTGWRILHLLTRCATETVTPSGAAATRASQSRTGRAQLSADGADVSTIDATLANAWGVTARGADLIRAALDPLRRS